MHLNVSHTHNHILPELSQSREIILIKLSFQRKEYVKYAKVFPLTTLFDIKIASKWYRRVVGSLEMLSGVAMILIPNRE